MCIILANNIMIVGVISYNLIHTGNSQLLVVIAAATLQIGRAPLMVAAEYGHSATVQSLLTARADMDIQDKVSNAPQPELHPHICNHVLACGNECCYCCRMVSLHSCWHSTIKNLKLLRF